MPVGGRWTGAGVAYREPSSKRVADQYPIAPEVLALLQPSPCASAFLTSDCEMPNCLAIADGLTPALKAARTAFSLPVVNKPALSSAAALRRCGFALATGFSFSGLGGSRPRRSASTLTAASSASISTSSNRFSAPAKSVGKKWRCCEARLPGPALPVGTVEGPAAFTVGRAENRSGVVSAGRRVGMPQLCRRWLTAATAGRASHHIALAADRLFAAEAEHAVERPNDRLNCVRLDMDPRPNALPDHLRWSQERMRRPNSSLICSSRRPAEAHQSRHKLLPIRMVPGGAGPTKCTTFISAAVPMRGVKVISPHRPDDQRASIYDSLLFAHVWANCTGADKC